MADENFSELLTLSSSGLYCPAGDFYIDPWRPVKRAVITHAHSDHARAGSEQYLAAASSEKLLRVRLGHDINLLAVSYGEIVTLNGVRVSLHPAGHILGSSQIRLEYRGRIAVVTGDYKLGADSTTESFAPIPCNLLVTESTFGLPVFHWPRSEIVFSEINDWWRANQSEGKTSVIYGYSVGKAQRILAGLDRSVGPIYCHGAVHVGNQAYLESGIDLPPSERISDIEATRGKQIDWHRGIVIAPPSAHGTPWLRRFGAISTAMASGWMAIRGTRRRRAMDRGFVLSDHVDWPELLSTIHQCKPEAIWVTHGFSSIVARYLSECGWNAKPLKTQFVGESSDGGELETAADEAVKTVKPESVEG